MNVLSLTPGPGRAPLALAFRAETGARGEWEAAG